MFPVLSAVEYVRAVCELKNIPVSKMESDCNFSNGYLNPKKLKKFPYDRAVAIAKYLNIPLTHLLESKDSFDYPPHISKQMCEDISHALENNNVDIKFFIPPEIRAQINSGTYVFNNITYPQFSLLTGKYADDYMTDTGESAPSAARPVTDEDIKFALFGGEGEITDAMYEEVKRFAQMVKLREEVEKKKKE